MLTHNKHTPLPKLSTSLHWYHWLAVIGSLLMTLSAWYITSQQVKTKVEKQFDFQTKHIVSLVEERMAKYEEALQAGVAALHALSPQTDRVQWRTFATNLRIDERYPGINGLGVIHVQSPETLPDYLAWQRELQPDYALHPPHTKNEFWPITYIEPQQDNAKAVGLDMAHETNRYSAAIKARDSGLSQITGPIVLVQDSQKTPGFLFYAPWYQDDILPQSIEARRRDFIGLVYAPFIMNKLMDGTLTNSNRQVNFSIYDGNTLLYSELTSQSQDFDPKPMLSKEVELRLYGRSWRFQVQSTTLFRKQHSHHQPLVILIGGLLIDFLLFLLFFTLGNANKKANEYAKAVTQDLQVRQDELASKNKHLESINEELNQFTYIASHDLKEPLRTLRTFTSYLIKDVKSERWDRVDQDVHHVETAVVRMTNLVTALLDLSRATNTQIQLQPVAFSTLITQLKFDLKAQIENSKACFTFDDQGIVFNADQSLLIQAVENLVSNAIKFHKPGDTPTITVRAKAAQAHGYGLIEIEDKGIGIAKEQFSDIFVAFKRLHSMSDYDGTGIGLAIVKKVMDRLGGNVKLESTPGAGSKFTLVLSLSSSQTKLPPINKGANNNE